MQNLQIIHSNLRDLNEITQRNLLIVKQMQSAELFAKKITFLQRIIKGLLVDGLDRLQIVYRNVPNQIEAYNKNLKIICLKNRKLCIELKKIKEFKTINTSLEQYVQKIKKKDLYETTEDERKKLLSKIEASLTQLRGQVLVHLKSFESCESFSLRLSKAQFAFYSQRPYLPVVTSISIFAIALLIIGLQVKNSVELMYLDDLA